MPRHLILLLTLILPSLQTSFAQPLSFVASKESQIVVSGTSTLHDWKLTSREIKLQSSMEIANGNLISINSLSLDLRCESLKSGHTGMDKNTYSTLNTDVHKRITFVLSSATFSGEGIVGKGNVTVAGVTLPVTINSSYKVQSNGSISLSGSRELKMTDFKIEPPSFMFGTVKTGDQIVIDFDIQLVPQN